MFQRKKIIIIIICLTFIFLWFGLKVSNADQDYQQKIYEAQQNVDRLNLRILAQAIERYYLDKGQYPSDLKELVPDYLNEVPVAMTEDKTIIYRNEGDKYSLTNE